MCFNIFFIYLFIHLLIQRIRNVLEQNTQTWNEKHFMLLLQKPPFIETNSNEVHKPATTKILNCHEIGFYNLLIFEVDYIITYHCHLKYMPVFDVIFITFEYEMQYPEIRLTRCFPKTNKWTIEICRYVQII